MKIMVFTEGTVLMHANANSLTREERVKQSNDWGIQQEERSLNFSSGLTEHAPVGSVGDYASYIPNGNAVWKLTKWKEEGATICYLTSRRIESEIQAIKNVLQKYNFPDWQNLYYRLQNEDYKDVTEKILPDILIEDDCESIGGEVEMTYPHLKEDIKKKIKSVVVKEFGGIDYLPNNLADLIK